MIDNLRKVLLEPFNVKIQDYDKEKEKFYILQKKVLDNDCEKEFKKSVKELEKTFDKKSNEYLIELDKLKVEYQKTLTAFDDLYGKYIKVKQVLSNVDIYNIKKNIERINMADNLDELGITLLEAKKICDEYGFKFEGTDKELQDSLKDIENKKIKDLIDKQNKDKINF